MTGGHYDNGMEFINKPLLEWCLMKHIQATRSRPYRKNDNCFAEQKNYDAVRKTAFQKAAGLNDLGRNGRYRVVAQRRDKLACRRPGISVSNRIGGWLVSCFQGGQIFRFGRGPGLPVGCKAGGFPLMLEVAFPTAVLLNDVSFPLPTFR
jgi:transposase InsO family protein